MGYGHCPKCNSPEFVNLACRHVTNAINANQGWFDSEHFVYGDADDPDLGMIYSGTFCRTCIENLGLPKSNSFLNSITVDAALDAADGVCDGCLANWHKQKSLA